MRPKNFSTFMGTYDTLYGWKVEIGVDKHNDSFGVVLNF